MMLIILDKDPVKSAQLLPDKIKFKQLIELCQLICSAGISNVYKSIPQGKELQNWIKQNSEWTYFYLKTLINYCDKNNKVKIDTSIKFFQIANDLLEICNEELVYQPTKAIFRYSKDFNCDVKTNTELPIEECIEQYKKYIEWKKENNVKGY